MNDREKAAREKLAKRGVHVDKSGGSHSENWDGHSSKRIALPRLSDLKPRRKD